MAGCPWHQALAVQEQIFRRSLRVSVVTWKTDLVDVAGLPSDPTWLTLDGLKEPRHFLLNPFCWMLLARSEVPIPSSNFLDLFGTSPAMKVARLLMDQPSPCRSTGLASSACCGTCGSFGRRATSWSTRPPSTCAKRRSAGARRWRCWGMPWPQRWRTWWPIRPASAPAWRAPNGKLLATCMAPWKIAACRGTWWHTRQP